MGHSSSGHDHAPHDHDHDHDHGHDHGHDHHHEHAPTVTADSAKRVKLAMYLTAGFMLAEAIGGWISGSLALLADAGHMFSDSFSLGLALFAFYMGDKAPDKRRTFGYQRFQVLAAFINGLTLLGIAVWILIAAVQRFFQPVEVMAAPMLTIAVLGLLVNVVVFRILHGGDHENLNLRGALLHVMGDLLGSVAAIVASLVIMATGWMPIDPLLSMLAAALILRGAWKIVRRSGHTLLEGTPEGIDVDGIRAALEDIEGVVSVHDLHVWGLTPQDPLLSLHLVVRDDMSHAVMLKAAYARLHERFGISHATLQVEGEACLTGGDCQVTSTTHP
ncbi:cation diffusion facilitator family transporter [Chromohalobacter sp.]|jgi:cobalt-zinc-cadmium efflux system protein|uniref:cation diffusion facilitator family transporter n=1 Tax=Chromohalobacter sp. TaxID=50740 RepID=UPI001D8FA037|nr:cation diffusion facilitator family transporter [Chromohalobacter sp.]NQY47334.1 cation transporter [Chromohalobacter sp.]